MTPPGVSPFGPEDQGGQHQGQQQGHFQDGKEGLYSATGADAEVVDGPEHGECYNCNYF